MTKKETEENAKSKSTFVKTGAQAMGIKATDTAAVTEGYKQMPEHKQKAFKQDYANFYDLSTQEASKLDYNKLYAASRDVKPAKEDPLKNLPSETKEHPDFKGNTKKFFDCK